MKNRIFFPQSALDEWILDGKIEIEHAELCIPGTERRFELTEAAHVMAEVTSGEDPHQLVRRVKPVAVLHELGAEIIDTSMIIGENAYEIEPGWLGLPAKSFADYQREHPGVDAQSDEELLAKRLG